MSDPPEKDNDVRFITPSPVEKAYSFTPKQELHSLLHGHNASNMVITPTQQQQINQSTTTFQHALALQKQSVEGLMSLLRDMGKGYLHLCRFECQDAIELFTSLKPQHYQTGWVLAQIAKAFFEMSKYEEAIKYVNSFVYDIVLIFN